MKTFEKTVVFLGEKDTGKSSIISFLKSANREETPKPTYALDYSCAKRSSNTRKEVVHIYELGGGRQLSNLVSVALTKENFRSFAYVLVVDLSKPGNLIDDLNFWIDAIKQSV